MRISDRYRQIYDGVASQVARLEQKDLETVSTVLQPLYSAFDELEEQLESVGEIPQMKLEQRLSPTLLSVHAQLDRARVLLEKTDLQQESVNLWELEQQVYRLLNDL